MSTAQTETTAKRKAAPKPTLDAEGNPIAKTPKKVQEIVTVKTGALSTDVGPRILGMFIAKEAAVDKAKAVLVDAVNKDLQMKSELTIAIRRAAENDDGIDLSSAFRSDNRSNVNKLNDQLRIALGISEYKEVSTGVKKFQETAAANKIWSKMSKTQKSNFAHVIKLCAQSAAGLIDMKAKAIIDTKSGALLLTGPKVKEAFGQDTVTLDSKVTIGEGESAIKLAKKPSFQAVADIGKVNRDIVPARRADSRAATTSAGSVASYTSDQNFASLAKMVIDTLSKIATLSPAQVTACRSMQSAITTKLGKAN